MARFQFYVQQSRELVASGGYVEFNSISAAVENAEQLARNLVIAAIQDRVSIVPDMVVICDDTNSPINVVRLASVLPESLTAK